MGIILPLLFLSVFPLNLLYNFFGNVNAGVSDFVLTHRLIIYVSLLAPALITYFLVKKDYAVRSGVTAILSIAGFMQYFYTFDFYVGVEGLPFHLCNTAIILMVLAYVFKIKSVFYFTYFVNVSGAFFAIILPNISGDLASVSTMHFWFNHWYAFFLPILGITLKVYKRPDFKTVRAAIYIFTAYFLFAVFVNAWLNNFGSVDYFFLYKTFIVEKFMFLMPVKINFVLSFAAGGLTFKIFWLYDIIIYLAYIFFIFITWIIYSYFYKIADHYGELANLYLDDLAQFKRLKKELGGRPLSEPIYKEVNMVKITNFSKRYGNSKSEAVKNINLEVRDGEVFGFLGHNGAGKSTTIKSMVGISSITQGSISICGFDIQKQPLEAKRLIGYVSDNHAVYEHLTGREYINYVADLYDVPKMEREERFNKYVETFELKNAIDNEIKSYSHGMKQKVMVISSLIHDPKVWILDEPLTGLDPVSAFQIKKCIKEHAQKGNIVFFSSHIIEVVEKICDRIAIISKGELKGVYSVKELNEKNIPLENLFMSFITAKQE